MQNILNNNMKKTIIYEAEQLFKNPSSENKTVDFVIPQYILNKLRVKKGDKLKVTVLENGTLLIKKENNEQE